MDIFSFIDNNPIYVDTSYINEKNDNMIMCNNDQYIKLLVAIDANLKVKCIKTKITDGRGQKHLFIYDKKDRIFKNKKKNKILCPHLLTIIIMWRMGVIDEEQSVKMSKKYNKFYNKETDLLNKEIKLQREINHTGNHYRNHFVSIPPKAIGQ
jgi:hypothetical protein